MKPPQYNRLSIPPDIEARIEFLSTAEGGRHGPVASGYRPNHDFGLPGELNDAQHEYPNNDWVEPGQSALALLWLFSPNRQTGRLYPGFKFKVQEGGHIVGNGEIVSVLNKSLQSPQFENGHDS